MNSRTLVFIKVTCILGMNKHRWRVPPLSTVIKCLPAYRILDLAATCEVITNFHTVQLDHGAHYAVTAWKFVIDNVPIIC